MSSTVYPPVSLPEDSDDHQCHGIPLALTIPEIVYYVLGFLQHDGRSLRASSLVCRTWGIFTARYLFFAIRFTPAYVMRTASIGGRELLQPVHVWLSDRSRVWSNVREVIIDNDYSLPASTTIDPRRDRILSHIFPQLLSDICATFPHLNSLRILGHPEFSLACTPMLSKYPFRVSPESHLDHLEINVMEETFHDAALVDVLATFTRIDTLVLISINHGMRSYLHGVSATTLRSKVSSLVLQGFWGSAVKFLCYMLSISIDIPSLLSLSVFAHYPGVAVQSINEHLLQPGTSLSEFVFSIADQVTYAYSFPKHFLGA